MDTFEHLAGALAPRYRLEREIGAGGMARVYLAHDVRHQRPVALKVVRPELAAGVGIQRFLSEIRTAANLQHPNIVALHDSGEVEGMAFYVMPFVAGESLRERLRREGQLAVEDAVRIATDVAAALDYAHRHGVLHRDIKPENVLLQDSRALVADFGVALALASGEATQERLTETGVALGTLPYMAPEQAAGGRRLTSRVDIYALGCVTYEMLMGEAPFTGATPHAIVSRILTEEPRPLGRERPAVPVQVEAAVLRALSKVPADRFADAAMFARALTSPTSTPALSVVGRRLTRTGVAVGAGVVLVALTAALLVGWLLDRRAPATSRYVLAFPAGRAPDANSPIRLSPDGRHLLFAARGAGSVAHELWIKRQDQFDATVLAGTTGASSFTFSPDGNSVAFVQDGRLKKQSLDGGPPVIVADSASQDAWQGLAWLEDGSLVYVHTLQLELRRVGVGGAAARAVFRSDSTFLTQVTALPGSRGVLFVRCHGRNCVNQQELWALRLSDGAAFHLQSGVVRAVYAPTGHLVMLGRDGVLRAASFDIRTLAITGSLVPVVDSIGVQEGIRDAFDLAPSGMLVARRGPAAFGEPLYRIVWVSRSGMETPVDTSWALQFSAFTAGGSEAGWSLSRDGRRVAVGLRTPTGDDIWIKDLPNGPLSRVTFSKRPHGRPRWAPDGRSILFISTERGRLAAFEVPSDGSGQERVVLEHERGVLETAMSGDGGWIVGRVGVGHVDVANRDVVAKRRGDTTIVPVLASPFVEAAFALSPDSRWIAHQSNETGRVEVYVREFPDATKSKRQVSAEGGYAPLWSRDGRELFYMSAGGAMTVVPFGRDGSIGRPRVLWSRRPGMYGTANDAYTPWDIAPDGRFLMARRVAAADPSEVPVVVVENWLTELRQLMGGRRSDGR